MKFTCAIVEDDSISRQMIEGLAEKTDLLTIEGSFSSTPEAARWLHHNNVDLLLLDIEMPDLTGLELFHSLPYKPSVIIISGSPHYAVDAFELSFVDYLVKPIKDYSRFLAAVNKFVATRTAISHSSKTASDLFVKIDSLLLKLKVEDILWAEAFGDYVKVQTKDKLHTIYTTLKKLEEKLSKKNFVRVHRSYLVNIHHITNIDSGNLEINKKVIPVSNTYKGELLSKISVL
jgi:DNA-binding LytR/AlgR family response regulator